MEQPVSKKLIMSFLTDEDTTVSMTLDDPIDDVEAETVSAVMEELVLKNVFQDKDGNNISISAGAKVRAVTDNILF